MPTRSHSIHITPDVVDGRAIGGLIEAQNLRELTVRCDGPLAIAAVNRVTFEKRVRRMDATEESTTPSSSDGASGAAAAKNDAKSDTKSDTKASGPWTVRALLAWINGFLKDRDVDSPRSIAEILLASTLRVERLKLYMEPDRVLDADELTQLRALVARAGRHEPVQFLVGRWPFLGREFEVAPCTLIPRPCTELLVDRALEWYRARSGGSARVLELGTGTGCIAVSLALGMRAIDRPQGSGCRPLASEVSSRAEVGASVPTIALHHEQNHAVNSELSNESNSDAEPTKDATSAPSKLTIIATDIVADAVALATRNAVRLGAPPIDFRVGDLWAPVQGEAAFDLLISNPPYVTDEEYEALDRNVREYEPASALRGGRDGLDVMRRIAEAAPSRVASGGMVLLEIGWKHRDAARALFRNNAWRDVEVLQDGDALDRVLVAHRV